MTRVVPARAFRLAPADLRSSIAPLLWLIAGFVLTQLYIRGIVFPADLLAPLPTFPPQAIILTVLLLTPVRQWPIFLTAYYGMHVADRLLFSNASLGYALVGNVVNVVEPLV